MDLFSTHGDPRNTTFLDGHGFPVYQILTNSSFTSSGTSTISRLVLGPGGAPQPVIIATIEWHSFKPSVFRLRGLTLKADDYIKSSGTWTRKRTFSGPSGRSYTWKSTQLTIANGPEVARWHNKSHGFFRGKVHSAYLQVAPKALQDVDEIVVTCVYQVAKMIEDGDDAVVAGTIGASAAIGVSS